MTLNDFIVAADAGTDTKLLSKMLKELPVEDRREAGIRFQGARIKEDEAKKAAKNIKEQERLRQINFDPFWQGWMCGWFCGPAFIWKHDLNEVRIDISDMAWEEDTEKGGILIITGDNLRVKWKQDKS